MNKFWKSISAPKNLITKIKNVCIDILDKKQEIDFLFEKLNSFFVYNIEMTKLNYYYQSYIIFGPVNSKLYEKNLSDVKNHMELECIKEKTLYSLDPNCLIISIYFEQSNLGFIAWMSNNTIKILEIEEKNVRLLKINEFMPQTISNIHDDLLKQFLNTAKSTLINEFRDIWVCNFNKKLFKAKISIKILMTSFGIQIVGFIRRESEKTMLLVNKDGEIDCFGVNFSTITNQIFNIPTKIPNISFLLFCPQMIPLFINNWYNLKSFELLNFKYKWLEDSFIFVYKDLQVVLENLSDILKSPKKNNYEYITALYNYLRSLEFDQIEKVFQISISFNEIKLLLKEQYNNFWEFTIRNYKEVTGSFTIESFKQMNIFLDKMNLTRNMIYSIEKYEERKEMFKEKNEVEEEVVVPIKKKMETNLNISNDQNSIMKSKNELNPNTSLVNKKIGKSMVMEGKNDVQLQTMKNSQFQAKSNNKKQYPALNDLKKKKKSSVIRSLFTRPMSKIVTVVKNHKARENWINLFNTYIHKRNNFINPNMKEQIGTVIRIVA